MKMDCVKCSTDKPFMAKKKPIAVKVYRTWVQKVIHTLEGDLTAEPGDYIITGINGEQYPCKPDIFEKTYNIVDEHITVKEEK